MTTEFHNTIYLHGPHEPTVRWTENAGPHSPGFASIQTSGASILVHTVAEADALIRAAVAAKDLLLAAQEPEPPLVVAPECAHGDHGACWDDIETGPGEHPCECPHPHPAAPPLCRDIIPGDLDAIPANRIGEPAPPPIRARCGATDQSWLCEEAPGHLGDHAVYVDGSAVHRWPQAAPLPPGHGENHIGNAGNVIPSYDCAGNCQPGECITCGGHADAAGNWHPAAVTA